MFLSWLITISRDHLQGSLFVSEFSRCIVPLDKAIQTHISEAFPSVSELRALWVLDGNVGYPVTPTTISGTAPGPQSVHTSTSECGHSHQVEERERSNIRFATQLARRVFSTLFI